MRCLHEKKMVEQSCFITLTYNDEHVPINYSVSVREWQLFLKRLRKQVHPKLVRFFMCGEYGDQDNRPHYHALIFGHDFSDDRKLWTVRRGYPVFRSVNLEKVWPYGFSEIGQLDYKSAAYCARYVMKKVPDKFNPEHYWRRSPIDGQMYEVEPEFALMSTKPGLGTEWFKQFSADAFPSDFLIVDGRKVKPPKFYLNKIAEGEALVLKKNRPATNQLDIKRNRKLHAQQHKEDNTPERLKVREMVHAAKIKLLKREL